MRGTRPRARAAARRPVRDYSRRGATNPGKARPMGYIETADSPDQPDFLPPGSATLDDFHAIDMRVGRVIAVEAFPRARKPAYRLTIDFGRHGTRRSSAQLPPTYPDPQALVGRLIIAVVNFASRNIAGFESQVLVLGGLPSDGSIPLLSVDQGAKPGDSVG